MAVVGSPKKTDKIKKNDIESQKIRSHILTYILFWFLSIVIMLTSSLLFVEYSNVETSEFVETATKLQKGRKSDEDSISQTLNTESDYLIHKINPDNNSQTILSHVEDISEPDNSKSKSNTQGSASSKGHQPIQKDHNTTQPTQLKPDLSNESSPKIDAGNDKADNSLKSEEITIINTEDVTKEAENLIVSSNADEIEESLSRETRKSSDKPIHTPEIEPISSFNKESTSSLKELYNEVEHLSLEILKNDPENYFLKDLAPHLKEVLKDMEDGKYSGLEDSLKHIREVLKDLNYKISQDGVSDPSRMINDSIEKANSQRADKNKDEGTEEEKSDVSSSSGGSKPNVEDSSSFPDGKTPVDEVIPDPIYFAPLGNNEQQGKKSKDDILQSKIKQAMLLAEKDLLAGLRAYDTLLEENSAHLDILIRRAELLDAMAEKEKSNKRLEQAIYGYRAVLDLAEGNSDVVPKDTYRKIGLLCAARMSFRGWHGKSIRVLQNLVNHFPDDAFILNKLGVAFLLINQPAAALDAFRSVLDSQPKNGFAQVHYGYILKTSYDNNTVGIKYLRDGIDSGAEGTSDGRFYFHLGDALQRLGKTDEAYKVYDEGVSKGLFRSRYQRSLYNVDKLTARPLWTLEQTTYKQFFRKLETHWEEIREEGERLLSTDAEKGFLPEAENLRDTGNWQQFELFSRGKKIASNCARAPKTCALIEDFAPAAGCKRGQIKFSVMQAGTHVWSHTGPTNCRLRAHLGLVVPKGLRMRVTDDFLSWDEGKIFVFDDSFEHEVWHRGDSHRLVLIIDVWHPDLTEEERRTLSPI